MNKIEHSEPKKELFVSKDVTHTQKKERRRKGAHNKQFSQTAIDICR